MSVIMVACFVALVTAAAAYAAPNTTIGTGQNNNQQPPLDPTDAGTVTQNPYFGGPITIPPVSIVPEMIEVFAEPYHKNVIAFKILGGDIFCGTTKVADNINVYKAESNKDHMHAFIHDNGTHNDATVLTFNTSLSRGATMTLHGGEINDDGTFHINGILDGDTRMCSHYMTPVEITGNCDGSTISLQSKLNATNALKVVPTNNDFGVTCFR